MADELPQHPTGRSVLAACWRGAPLQRPQLAMPELPGLSLSLSLSLSSAGVVASLAVAVRGVQDGAPHRPQLRHDLRHAHRTNLLIATRLPVLVNGAVQQVPAAEAAHQRLLLRPVPVGVELRQDIRLRFCERCVAHRRRIMRAEDPCGSPGGPCHHAHTTTLTHNVNVNVQQQASGMVMNTTVKAREWSNQWSVL
jgi:hypothetical protein